MNSVRHVYQNVGCSFLARPDSVRTAVARNVSPFTEAPFIAVEPYLDGRDRERPSVSVLTREHYGLRNNSLVLCDFNVLYKV